MDINFTLQHLARVAKWQRWVLRLSDAGYVAFGLGLVTLLFTGYHPGAIIGSILLPLILVPSSIALGICLWTMSSTGGRQMLISAIDGIEDARDLGSLLEAYGVDDLNVFAQTRRTLSGAVGDAIKRLLRHIDAGAECFLDAAQREQLRRLLFPMRDMHRRTHYDPNLVREVLRTLEIIGAQADVKAIKRLLRNGNLSPDLREAARLCQTRIEERLSLQQPSETLLRSAASASSPDEMLRPVSATKPSAPEIAEQMLRPCSPQKTTNTDETNFSFPNSEWASPPEPAQKVQIGRDTNENTP